MKNLVQRGFAVQAGQGQIGLDGIRIEKEGLLMGEVIADTQGTRLRGVRYRLFYTLTWATVIAGVMLLFQKFIIDMGVWALLKRLFICICRGT